MANYRKSFNLRNGVQVDDDNFIVNANGLVGIGTSVPTEFLDVRGNATISGFVTSSNLRTPSLQVTGVGTFSTFTDGIVRINSGIVTASSVSGVVTYYGDGKGLINIPTSQWVDIDPGIGQTSIYAIGRVGIATTNPSHFFQVGGNPLGINTGGVGFNSTGNIIASGIITATSGFYGLQLDNVNVNTGVSTFLNIKSTNISAGVITATTQFYGSLTGIAQSASSITGIPNINVGVTTALSVNSGFSTSGVSTVTTELDVGIGGTAFTASSSGKVGIGTALPTSELQIRKASGTLLEVISDTNEATISVGQSVGIGKSTAVLRFGFNTKDFDIINNDTGNLNFYVHGPGSPSGINTGRFDWYYGKNISSPLMSLTYGGKLGIAKTNPDETLHVVGTSTVTQNSYVGGNFEVKGSLSFGSGVNKLTLASSGGVLQSVNLYNTNGITTLSQLTVTGVSSIGIGTDKPEVGLDARYAVGMFNNIGVGTYNKNFNPALYVNGQAAVSSKFAIGSTSPSEANTAILQVNGKTNFVTGDILVSDNIRVGINSDLPIAPLDMRYANVNASLRGVFYPPVLTTAQRNAITPSWVTAGAIIYNSDVSKHQGYNGSTWNDFW